MKVLKKYLLDILAVVLFAIVSFVYFMPADMDGRILFRHDASAGKGLGHEKELFQQQPVRCPAGPTPFSAVCLPTRCHHPTRAVPS